MSYSEEKMMILKMLQEGKINSDEAARLLEALDGSAKQTASDAGQARQQQKAQPNYNDEIAKMRERIKEWKDDFKKNYNQKDFDKVVDEFSTKAEKIGKNVAATTFGLVDRMIDFVGSVVDTGSFNIFGNMNVVEKNFEAAAQEGMDLDLEAINGQIFIKKHQENKILIKTRIRSSLGNPEAALKYSDTGNAVSLKIDKTGNISVSLEVYMPAVKFNKLRLESLNGRIYVEDTLSNELESITKNASIDLMGVNSDKISVSTKNAKITLTYVTGKDVNINTNNSLIEIKNIKAGNLQAVTTNGRIYLENVQNSDGVSEESMFLKTTNGDIKVNMNDMDSKAYKVKAQTTNGSVNLLIPEMIYHNAGRQANRGNFVDAESSSYEASTQKVNITAETVNGYIEIVK